MATSKTVFLALVAFVVMVLIAGFAWTAGHRNKDRAASPRAQPESKPADVGDDRPASTTAGRQSALDSSTTQWDRADTREVTKGTSP
jgi:hypothetical protein